MKYLRDRRSVGDVHWRSGTWTTPPIRADVSDHGLRVVAAKGSDAWRHTSYGFVHSSEHALLARMPVDTGVEVSFVADLSEQFDQAGVYLQVDESHWIKAGVEYVDGVVQIGAVVTDGWSDWSSSPVPDWLGRTVTLRVSRTSECVTIRARVDEEDFRLIRLAPLRRQADIGVGPYLSAPTRDGLTIEFLSWTAGDPDADLHASR